MGTIPTDVQMTVTYFDVWGECCTFWSHSLHTSLPQAEWSALNLREGVGRAGKMSFLLTRACFSRNRKTQACQETCLLLP